MATRPMPAAAIADRVRVLPSIVIATKPTIIHHISSAIATKPPSGKTVG